MSFEITGNQTSLNIAFDEVTTVCVMVAICLAQIVCCYIRNRA